jgi:hypothetical protein
MILFVVTWRDMSSGSKERKESEHLSIVDAYPSTSAARPAPAPNYFGQLPAPRQGGDEEDALTTVPLFVAYTNRGNDWRFNEIRVVSYVI